MFDQRFLYFPSAWEEGDWRAASGLPIEDVWIPTRQGRLFGWYLDASPRRAVLLWCHGNAGNIIHRLEPMAEFHRRGLSLLIFDYRGYGRSPGRPSEEGLYADALAAYDHLVGAKAVDPRQLVLFGTSLGAAVAGEVAAKRPAAGLILETPFPSVAAVARQLYGLPLHYLLRARFDLARRLRDIRMPVLVVHGDRDTIIPLALGERVFEAAREPKTLYRIPGADHNDTYLVGGEAYFERILEFVRRVVEET